MYEEAKEITGLREENALGGVHLEVMSAHPCEHLPEVFHVGCSRFGFDYHIVDVDFDQLAQDVVEDEVHGALVRCPRVLKAEGHDDILERASETRATEGGLVSILLGDGDLMVPGRAVHKG